jgi:hypothetical protein
LLWLSLVKWKRKKKKKRKPRAVAKLWLVISQHDNWHAVLPQFDLQLLVALKFDVLRGIIWMNLKK